MHPDILAVLRLRTEKRERVFFSDNGPPFREQLSCGMTVGEAVALLDPQCLLYRKTTKQQDISGGELQGRMPMVRHY